MNDDPNYTPDKPIWKSYVWHDQQCFFVSTIERDYSIAALGGKVRGAETLAWRYDYELKVRGDLIYHGGGVGDHQIVCRILIFCGKIPDQDDELWERFGNKQR